jgi:hypothetical protein
MNMNPFKSKLELQLVLQLQVTKNPTLLPPMQKYLKWVVAEKRNHEGRISRKNSRKHTVASKINYTAMKTEVHFKFLLLAAIPFLCGIFLPLSLHADEAISAVPATSETIPLAPQLDSSSAALSPPEIPINGAGEEYLPNLEKMKKHLKESNLSEFFLEAGRFVKKIEFTRKEKRIGTYQLNGKEEHVACEWFSYYLAKSSLFSDEWLYKNGLYEYNTTDIELKKFALDYILAGNIEKRAALLGVDKRKLRMLYLNYAKNILIMLNTTSIELEKLRKQDWEIFRMEEKTWKSDDELDDEGLWRRKAKRWSAQGLLFRRGNRIDKCRGGTGSSQGDLLLRLIEEYPNNASRIHAFFFEIGYSKEELVRMFLKECEYSREVREAKYLFNGLPKSKEVKSPSSSNKPNTSRK